LNGQDLLGNAVNADASGNCLTTMREIFDYIINHESDSATPQYDDGSRNLGEQLHLMDTPSAVLNEALSSVTTIP
jgi:hypothetical protein